MDQLYLSVEQAQDLLKGNPDFINIKDLFPSKIATLIAYIATNEGGNKLGHDLNKIAAWHIRLPEGGRTYVYIDQSLMKQDDGTDRIKTEWATFPSLEALHADMKRFKGFSALQPEAYKEFLYQLGA